MESAYNELVGATEVIGCMGELVIKYALYQNNWENQFLENISL